MFNPRYTRVLLILLTLTTIIGCTANIKDYDSEKLEAERVNKLSAAQKKQDPFNSPATANYVKIADNDDVFVEAIKLKPLDGPKHIRLDHWTINATNRSNKTVCVSIKWKLQDFEFTSELPLEFLMMGKESLKVGDMKQSIWSFDDALIAIPPSGYVDSMNVRDAKVEPKTGKYTCDLLEEDIQEPKGDHD